jgi:hypothetical protein
MIRALQAMWLSRAALSAMSSLFAGRDEDKESAAALIFGGIVPIC